MEGMKGEELKKKRSGGEAWRLKSRED